MKDWFFHQERGKTLGPITVDEIKNRIREGRIRLTDLIFKDGEPGWRMALEFPDLRPEFQTSAVQTLKERPWVCLQRKHEASFEFVTQGPFSEEELKRAILAGKLSYSDYVWRDGFKEWRRIGSLPEFNRRVTQPPPKIPPLPDLPGEEVVKNVVEFRRPRLPEPEPPPPEADLGIEETVIRPPPVVPKSEDRRKKEEPPPTPPKKAEDPPSKKSKKEIIGLVAKVEPELEVEPAPGPDEITAVTNAADLEAKEKKPKSLLVDWGIVAGLAMMLLAAVFAVSSYVRKSPPAAPQETAEMETTEAKARIPEPTEQAEQTVEPATSANAGIPGGIPVTEDPPAETKVVGSKLPPTQLELKVQSVGANQIKIELKTDATPDYPVYLQIVGPPGQVSDGAAYYRYLKFIPKGDGMKPLDLSGLKLPQGKFIFRAATGELRKEDKVSVGVNEAAYKNAVNRLRKQNAHLVWKERLQLFKLAQDLEKGITEALGGKKFSSKPFEALNSVKRSNGASYVMYDNWWELKEIFQAAQGTPSQAVLERARKARERLAVYSVWK